MTGAANPTPELKTAPLDRLRVLGKIAYMEPVSGGLREPPIRPQEGDMPATGLTDSPPRELASRVSSGTETTLFWNQRTGAVTVSVWDRDSDQHLEFAVLPAKALDAFYHPYAYAAPVARARTAGRSQ